jgi:hypothetical protein
MLKRGCEESEERGAGEQVDGQRAAEGEGKKRERHAERARTEGNGERGGSPRSLVREKISYARDELRHCRHPSQNQDDEWKLGTDDAPEWLRPRRGQRDHRERDECHEGNDPCAPARKCIRGHLGYSVNGVVQCAAYEPARQSS